MLSLQHLKCVLCYRCRIFYGTKDFTGSCSWFLYERNQAGSYFLTGPRSTTLQCPEAWQDCPIICMGALALSSRTKRNVLVWVECSHRILGSPKTPHCTLGALFDIDFSWPRSPVADVWKLPTSAAASLQLR